VRKARRLLQEYGAGETPQALAPRRLAATPAESEVPRDRQRPPVPAKLIQEAFLSGAQINRNLLTQPSKNIEIVNNLAFYY
jgi:hypothetical protein